MPSSPRLHVLMEEAANLLIFYPRNITCRPLDRPIAFHDIRQYTAKQKMSFAYDFEKHVPSEEY